ncbi:MAG: hypothetical protein J6Y37_09465 [Paludibacteraceae bacterium]|nr:hypothetical protein [Paludibacteraceae bacterium]
MKTIILTLALFPILIYGQTLEQDIADEYSKLNQQAYLQAITELVGVDCINGEKSKDEWEKDMFLSTTNSQQSKFVLNLIIEKDLSVKVDTNHLKFNIFDLDKNANNCLFVMDDKCLFYSWYLPWIGSPKMAKRANKAMGKILKKNPTHLLSCHDIFGLLYMLSSKIYVYDLLKGKEYELDYYMHNIYKNDK